MKHKKRQINHLNSHATMRLYERVGTHINPDKILRLIKNKSVIINIVQRYSETRSLAYLKIDNTPLKIVLHRKNNIPITVLPLTEDFETNDYYVCYKHRLFKIKIFPDCYKSTKDSRKLTEFRIYDKALNSFVSMRMKKEYFEPVFYVVLKDYLERRQIEKINIEND